MLIETDRKLVKKVKRSGYGKGTNDLHTKIVIYASQKWFAPPGGLYCFFRWILFLCSNNQVHHNKKPTEKNNIKCITRGISTK